MIHIEATWLGHARWRGTLAGWLGWMLTDIHISLRVSYKIKNAVQLFTERHFVPNADVLSSKNQGRATVFW